MRISEWTVLPAARAAVALVVAALAATLVPGALADRTVVRDPRGDTLRPLRPYLDIRRAIAAHESGARLRHVAVMQRATSNTARALQVHLWSRGRRYTIFGMGIGSTPIYIVRKNGASTGKTSGTARVRRRGRRIVFSFHRSSIGNPSAYRWRIEGNPNPGIFTGRYDRAPNRGTKRHRLS